MTEEKITNEDIDKIRQKMDKLKWNRLAFWRPGWWCFATKVTLPYNAAVIFGFVAAAFVLAYRLTVDQQFMNTLMTATAQLAGFVALILTVFYPAQRLLLRDIHRVKNQWKELGDKFAQMSPEEKKKYVLNSIRIKYLIDPNIPRVPDKIFGHITADVDVEVRRTESIFALTLNGLLASFTLLAIDIVVELIHSSAFSLLTAGSVLFAFEIGLIVISIAVLVVVLAQSVERAIAVFDWAESFPS